jgi:hypothetical protein
MEKPETAEELFQRALLRVSGELVSRSVFEDVAACQKSLEDAFVPRIIDDESGELVVIDTHDDESMKLAVLDMPTLQSLGRSPKALFRWSFALNDRLRPTFDDDGGILVLGLESNLLSTLRETMRNLAREAKAAGISIGTLIHTKLSKLLRLLEAKRELITLAGPLPEDERRARKLFGLEAGRPPGVQLDVGEIKAAMGNRSRADFARSCRIPVKTLARVLSGNRVSETSANKILNYIKTKQINQGQKTQ